MGETGIRVAHLFGSLIHGGVQTTALHLIRGLAGRGFNQSVVCRSRNAGDLYSEFAGLTPVHHCPLRDGRRFAYIRALAGVLRKARADVVLTHAFGHHALAGVAARLAGVPRAYVVVTGDPRLQAHGRWRALAFAHGGRAVATAEIAVSDTVGRILTEDLHLPARRVKVIPNGCDVENISRRAAGARRAAGNHTAGRILMAGRMDRTKDHPTLLQAAARLRAKNQMVELLLAGDGVSRVGIEALAGRLGIAGCVRFLGTRTDVPELMGTSDVLVLATESEGLPICLLEGMAAGVPVVATDIPPCREALAGGECGILVPGRDPEALAGAIECILTSPQRREELVRAATRRVRDQYDLPMMVGRYAALLRGRWSPAALG